MTCLLLCTIKYLSVAAQQRCSCTGRCWPLTPGHRLQTRPRVAFHLCRCLSADRGEECKQAARRLWQLRPQLGIQQSCIDGYQRESPMTWSAFDLLRVVWSSLASADRLHNFQAQEVAWWGLRTLLWVGGDGGAHAVGADALDGPGHGQLLQAAFEVAVLSLQLLLHVQSLPVLLLQLLQGHVNTEVQSALLVRPVPIRYRFISEIFI